MNCKGLVIGERIVGENGKFLDILTDELGLIEVAQKGVKSLKNENRSALQMFAYSNLCVDRSKKHYSVKSSDLIDSFYGMREDLCGLALASYISQVVTYTIGQHSTDSKAVLRLILNIFYYISNHKRPHRQLKSIFELRLISELGFSPNLLVCGRCELSLTQSLYFSIQQNSVICQNCADMNDLQISKSVLQAMQHIVFSDYDRLFNFKLSDTSLKLLNRITENVLLCTLNRGFSTLDYYKNISI
ncbi:MAG: DNA repair protein RecO [Ruminococcus sp.]|nr:DNA repair protein RecO [Ruminococcus sp.]MCD7800880.1 DNA repair protein RecO [Ruminococcus sp.]